MKTYLKVIALVVLVLAIVFVIFHKPKELEPYPYNETNMGQIRPGFYPEK